MAGCKLSVQYPGCRNNKQQVCPGLHHLLWASTATPAPLLVLPYLHISPPILSENRAEICSCSRWNTLNCIVKTHIKTHGLLKTWTPALPHSVFVWLWWVQWISLILATCWLEPERPVLLIRPMQGNFELKKNVFWASLFLIYIKNNLEDEGWGAKLMELITL